MWKGKNANKEEKQQAMSRALVSARGWWFGVCCSLGEAGYSMSRYWIWLPSGLHQSQELPGQHQRGDRERWV